MQDNQNNSQMNEDLAKAFESFGVGQPNAAQDEPAGDNTATGEAQPNEAPKQDQQTNATNVQSNQAFAKMRTENAAMAKQLGAIEGILKAQGYDSIDEYLEAQEQEKLQKQAQAQGIPVELERRLRALEAENSRYRQNENEARVRREADALVQKYNITREQWAGFINQLQEQDINPFTDNRSLEALYLSNNIESIINARIEAAKQGWMTQQQTVQQSAPAATPQSIGSAKPNPNDTRDPNVIRNIAAQFAKTH